MATSGEALKAWKAANRDADLRHKATYRERQRRLRDLVRETLAEESNTDTEKTT